MSTLTRTTAASRTSGVLTSEVVEVSSVTSSSVGASRVCSNFFPLGLFGGSTDGALDLRGLVELAVFFGDAILLGEADLRERPVHHD